MSSRPDFKQQQLFAEKTHHPTIITLEGIGGWELLPPSNICTAGAESPPAKQQAPELRLQGAGVQNHAASVLCSVTFAMHLAAAVPLKQESEVRSH